MLIQRVSEGYVHPRSYNLCSSGSYHCASRCHFSVSPWVFFSVFQCIACSLAVFWWKRTASVPGSVNTSLWGWWTGSARLGLRVGVWLMGTSDIEYVQASSLCQCFTKTSEWMSREQNIDCFYIQWREITRHHDEALSLHTTDYFKVNFIHSEWSPYLQDWGTKSSSNWEN